MLTNNKFINKYINKIYYNSSHTPKEINFIKLDGFFLFFLISITSSIFIKTFYDQEYIKDYNYNSGKKVNNYIIIIYTISTSMSLFFYLLYEFFLTKGEEKKQITTSTIEIFGYIIYNKSKKSNDIFCQICNKEYECESCEDCKICCETINRSLCSYKSSCKACWKKIFCCCFCCCSQKCQHYKCCEYCECDKLKETKYPIRKIKGINKIETLCIIYRAIGKCNWLGKILTMPDVYILVIFLYLTLLCNLGTEQNLWNNFENNQGGTKNSYCINGVVLGIIIFFYIFSRLIGKLLINYFGFHNSLISEYFEVLSGLVPYFFLQGLYSMIISGIIYVNNIKKSENILLSISIGSVQFIKFFILEYITFIIESNIKYLIFFSLSTIFSFYLLIWDIILFILELCELNYSSMILFNFIFCLALFGIYIAASLILPIILVYYEEIKHRKIWKELFN